MSEASDRSSDTSPGPERNRPEVLEVLKFHLVNSPLAVIEWDHQFRVVSWSGRATEVFGWREEEILGKNPEDWRFVHDEDREEVARVMEELLASRVPRNISANRNYTRDGDVLHCEWYNSVLADEEGQLVSVLSLVHDVTGRRTMEDQIHQLQKMESIGRLTGGVAHDFNNLLTVILGHGDLLMEELVHRPELRELAGEMMEAGRRGASLTHDLLSFARQQPLDPRSTDIEGLMERMEGFLRRTLGEQIELALITGREPRHAEVDPIQLESAVLNLCLNARDAMPEGGRLTVDTETVRIEEEESGMEADAPPGDYVVLSVSDTGSGIPADVLDRVFEPFFTTKEMGQGSGLGLSMVYGFVRQSRGELRIYSEVGHGTTVRMYLPKSAAEESKPTIREPETVPTGSETILVVEDDDLVRSYAELQLGALGYRVVGAADGPGALEALASRDTVELLFTDVIMPGGIHGPELARRARKLRPGLAVLFTSGYTQNAIVHGGRLDPGVLLLSKPYQRGSLARKVREALDATSLE